MEFSADILTDIFIRIYIGILIDMFIDMLTDILIDIYIAMFIDILTGKEEGGEWWGVDFFLKSNNPTPEGGEQRLFAPNIWKYKNDR